MVVSIDFIKADRRGRTSCAPAPSSSSSTRPTPAPEHGERRRGSSGTSCSRGSPTDADRHLILVTATPHSGKEEAFRSLLASRSRLRGSARRPGGARERSSPSHACPPPRAAPPRRHPSYLDEDTPFPDREEAEATYKLTRTTGSSSTRSSPTPARRCRTRQGGQQRQRVRWWAALACCVRWPPARPRPPRPCGPAPTTADTTTPEEADEVGRRSGPGPRRRRGCRRGRRGRRGRRRGRGRRGRSSERRGCRRWPQADDAPGRRRPKLTEGHPVDQGAAEGRLQTRSSSAGSSPPPSTWRGAPRGARKGVEVAAVTGTLPPEERERRVLELAEHDRSGCWSRPTASRRDQPPGALRRGRPLRPVLEPDAARAAGGPGRPLRPAAHQGAGAHVLRRRQPDRRVVLDVLLRKHKASATRWASRCRSRRTPTR